MIALNKNKIHLTIIFTVIIAILLLIFVYAMFDISMLELQYINKNSSFMYKFKKVFVYLVFGVATLVYSILMFVSVFHFKKIKQRYLRFFEEGSELSVEELAEIVDKPVKTVIENLKFFLVHRKDLKKLNTESVVKFLK